MKALKLLLYTCVFFIIGEALIRIDLHYDILNNAPRKISIEIETSNLLKDIDKGRFVADSTQIRVLVIGDSYINGGGIDPANKFSKKLSVLLKGDAVSEKEFVVLDVSRPSNNTLDNYSSFVHYQKIFKPHFVFWAYNFNDILGSIEIETPKEESQNIVKTKTPPAQTSKKRIGLKGFIKKTYSFSELSRYLSTNVQKELKNIGIVLPAGDFHYLTKKAYLKTSKNWQDTKEILDKASDISKLNQAEFILYKMPEFNLLHKPNLFKLIDEEMLNYCNSNKEITYINGINDFKNEDGNVFKLSKYDGHPNEKAHLKIAESMSKLIKKRIRSNNNK